MTPFQKKPMVGGYRRLKVTWNDTNCLAIELPKKEVVAIRRTGISDWTGPWNVLDDRSQSQDASALVEKKISRAPNFPGGKTHEWHRPLGQFQLGEGQCHVRLVRSSLILSVRLADSEDWSGGIKHRFDWCWSPLAGTRSDSLQHAEFSCGAGAAWTRLD